MNDEDTQNEETQNEDTRGTKPGSLDNYGEADDGQDYVDRSVIDFDPADGLLSGTAIDGTSEIPDPDSVAGDGDDAGNENGDDAGNENGDDAGVADREDAPTRK